MMDTEHKNSVILKFFCIAITCISVIQYDSSAVFGAYEFFNNVCDNYSTRIELVVRPPLDDTFQSRNNLSSSKQNNKPFSYHAAHISIHNFRPILTPERLIDQLSGGQQISSPIHHIISILHKQHTWHQSSDDEPFPITLL